MQRRRIATVLLLLLCITALLSGTLLILHTDHAGHQTACPICLVLSQNVDTFLCILAMLMAIGLRIDAALCGAHLPENRFIPDSTPVRQKVKLLN